MAREIDGFVVNRLQGALLEEAFRLVADGYATTEDIDIAIREGLAVADIVKIAEEEVAFVLDEPVGDPRVQAKRLLERYRVPLLLVTLGAQGCLWLCRGEVGAQATPKVNVGWSNYTTLLHMPALWKAVGTSGFFLVGLLIFGLFLPLLIATLAQHVSVRASKFYRALIFLPVLVSPIVTATLWEFLLSPVGGFVDTVIGWFGFAPTNWLQQLNTARYAIAITSGWKVLGVSVLVITAGLAAISTEYFEASAVDGASRLQTFRRVTLPLLSPTLLFMFITVVLLSSQIIFPLVNALTQGGPEGSTTDIYYFLYQNGFESFNVGLASAAAVCFFAVFAVIALVCVRLLDRFSFYDN